MNFRQTIPLIFLCLTAIVLIGLQMKLLGWVLLLTGLISLFFCKKQFAKHIVLIYISMALMGITPITTELSNEHIVEMTGMLMLALLIPYLVSKYIYKDHVVQFKWHNGRAWSKAEIFYIFLTGVISLFLIPFYLQSTRAYLNWSIEPNANSIIRLFIGTNALGIWDELFFISTVLGILRRHISFGFANIIQAVLFTSFLYELGFTGWGPVMIYLFALIQGYIFKKTDSLIYVITIHLTLDFILFLSLIHAYYPHLIPIFK